MLTVFTYVRTVVRSLGSRIAGERGQDLIEYALLSGILAAAIALVGAGVLTGALEDMAEGIGRCIDFDSGTTCNV